jgi:hypothetical protein
MPIPEFDALGYLPAGEHVATWPELEASFGTSIKRKYLLRGLGSVVQGLRLRGVVTIWVDGSFVTSKVRPSDVDVIYVPPPGTDHLGAWGPLSFANHEQLKEAFAVDLWPYPAPQSDGAGGEITILEFFTKDRDDRPKGYVRLERGG